MCLSCHLAKECREKKLQIFFFIDNESTLVLTKNLIFHDRSKHINTRSLRKRGHCQEESRPRRRISLSSLEITIESPNEVYRRCGNANLFWFLLSYFISRYILGLIIESNPCTRKSLVNQSSKVLRSLMSITNRDSSSFICN